MRTTRGSVRVRLAAKDLASLDEEVPSHQAVTITTSCVHSSARSDRMGEDIDWERHRCVRKGREWGELRPGYTVLGFVIFVLLVQFEVGQRQECRASEGRWGPLSGEGGRQRKMKPSNVHLVQDLKGVSVQCPVDEEAVNAGALSDDLLHVGANEQMAHGRP
ncbi:hypothetical protein C8R46DRAFT_1065758 [Mycena filopes]|nr:hypothetical protein C8R46DRAFT_1065758 [Mycena filopes]